MRPRTSPCIPLAIVAVVAVFGRRARAAGVADVAAPSVAQPDAGGDESRARSSHLTNRGWESYAAYLPPGGPPTLPALLDELIAAHQASAYTRGRPFRILELGAGEGRVLLQLKARYPTADVVGVNRFQWLKGVDGAQNSAEPADLMRAAQGFGITGLSPQNLPRIVDHTLPNTLPFDAGTFDVVLSQHTLNHMGAAHKLTVLQDVKRVLAQGGFALVMWTGYKAKSYAFPEGRYQLVARSTPVIKASRSATNAVGIYRCCIDKMNHALGSNSHGYANVVVFTVAGVTVNAYEAVVGMLDGVQASTEPTTIRQVITEESRLTVDKRLGLSVVARWVEAESALIARLNEKAQRSRDHRRE